MCDNSIDDNCNGLRDEGCGGCTGNETELCDDGMDNDCDGLVDEDCGTCITVEICDGIDNDNDGEVDEGFDRDGDGFTICGGDCNDTDMNVNPDAPELCDGKDNNCNGVIDADGNCG